MKKYLFLALSVVIVIAACNRTPTITKTRLDELRASKWKLSSGTLKVKLPNGKDTTLNYLDYLPACHHDDYFGFNSSTIGAVFNGANRCNPAEGDSSQFTWELTNNYNTISFYRGFSFIWSVKESVLSGHFDTTQTVPYIVVDTIHGVNDTLPGFTRVVVVLDTIWNLQFDRDSVSNFNIYNAQITDYSTSAFTINFSMYSTYPDTTNFHQQLIVIPGINDTIGRAPIIRPDTFKYKLTYTAM